MEPYIKIHVYLTTRTDTVKDLDEIKELWELKKWSEEIKKHAIKILEHETLNPQIIEETKNYTIQECYAVITHPIDRYREASHIGNLIKKFLKENSDKLRWELNETGISATSTKKLIQKNKDLDPEKIWENFTYGIVTDKTLKGEEYHVFLEFVVKPSSS